MGKAVRAGNPLTENGEQLGERASGRIAEVPQHLLHPRVLHIAAELRLVVDEKQVPCVARTDDLEPHSARREGFAVGFERFRQVGVKYPVAGNEVRRLDARKRRRAVRGEQPVELVFHDVTPLSFLLLLYPRSGVLTAIFPNSAAAVSHTAASPIWSVLFGSMRKIQRKLLVFIPYRSVPCERYRSSGVSVSLG